MQKTRTRWGSRSFVFLVLGVTLLFLGFLAGYAWQDFQVASGSYVITAEGKSNQDNLLTKDGKIDINTAGKTDLMDLPGIGPAMAERILASRETEGPFRVLEDLLRVSGVGEKSLERLRDYIIIREETMS